MLLVGSLVVTASEVVGIDEEELSDLIDVAKVFAVVVGVFS